MEEYGCSWENFIMKDEKDPAYSICREERQYAVFLYDILRKYKTVGQREEAGVTNIFIACGLDGVEINDVFYEPTFMRDLFERNRRIVLGTRDRRKDEILLQKTFTPKGKDYTMSDEKSFNDKLIRYICGKQEDMNETETEEIVKMMRKEKKEYNLGHPIEKIDQCESIQNIVRQMMNTKPDLAVIYTKDQKSYLLFLECKFEYYETVDQRKIHGRVADFLCNCYLKGKFFVSENMKIKENDKEKIESHLVQFERKNPDPYKQEIGISDLIHLSEKIFE